MYQNNKGTIYMEILESTFIFKHLVFAHKVKYMGKRVPF